MPATSFLEATAASVNSLRTMITDAYPGLLPQRHTIVSGRVPERIEACHHALYLLDILSDGLREMTERKKEDALEGDFLKIMGGLMFVCGILWAQGFDSGPMKIEPEPA